ncbi:MAG: TrkH family potassium uptake protein [Bacteroidales bacterium]|jgi:trk system potassium uptake protein TrkH
MFKDKVYRIRESINIRLYTHKAYVVRSLHFASIIVSLVAMAAIILQHGFKQTPYNLHLTESIIEFSLIFYVLKFLTRIFYEFHPIDFIKENRVESVLLLFILFDQLVSLVTGAHLIQQTMKAIGFPGIHTYYNLFVQFYFFVIIAVELGKAGRFIDYIHIGPSGLLVLSFIFIILAGAGLLMLPEMTVSGISAIDALFTSTSACCVTGLVVVDTSICFTLKGKTIIMMLIQVGGLNIISFATLFASFYRNSSGIKLQSLIKDMVSTDKLSNTRSMLRKIFLYSIFIELGGAFLLFITWPNELIFKGIGEKIYFSVFHSVSAFNNAGFGLFTDNLYDLTVRHAYNLQLVIAALIFLGGIGFMVLEDVFKIDNIRERRRIKWKKLQTHSRIALYTSAILIVVGAVVFYLVEYKNSIAGYGIYGSVVSSIFQSVSCRTAGFNTVDFTHLGQPVLILMMFLMFIGASPGSTGGGIKTTTFSVILRSAISTIKGRKNVEIVKHTISSDTISKAYSIALFSISLIFISTFVLSITEPDKSFLSLLFEEISAFGTVGLSTGITSTLSYAGKSIIILTMYIGRIGTLTLAFAITKRVVYTKYRYSEINVLVG